jgi:hypothetical protein
VIDTIFRADGINITATTRLLNIECRLRSLTEKYYDMDQVDSNGLTLWQLPITESSSRQGRSWYLRCLRCQIHLPLRTSTTTGGIPTVNELQILMMLSFSDNLAIESSLYYSWYQHSKCRQICTCSPSATVVTARRESIALPQGSDRQLTCMRRLAAVVITRLSAN